MTASFSLAGTGMMADALLWATFAAAARSDARLLMADRLETEWTEPVLILTFDRDIPQADITEILSASLP